MTYITLGLVLVAGWSATVLYWATTGNLQGISETSKALADKDDHE